MSIVFAVLTALAVWEIVEIWHHSALFATWRERAAVRDGWFFQMISCPFCLTPWVSLFFVLVYRVGGTLLASKLPDWALELALTPLYAFAIARLANLGNDAFHRFCRTPHPDKLPSDTPEEGI